MGLLSRSMFPRKLLSLKQLKMLAVTCVSGIHVARGQVVRVAELVTGETSHLQNNFFYKDPRASNFNFHLYQYKGIKLRGKCQIIKHTKDACLKNIYQH